MRYRRLTGALTLAAMLGLSVDGAQAFDEDRFPDWKGQWVRSAAPAIQLGIRQSRRARASRRC